MESISSKKITLGARSKANANRPRISFSPSPIHLEVRVEALMLKKVDLHSVATALASKVLPVPGGPYRRMPLLGAYRPLKMSGRSDGNTIVSFRICFTSASPLISSQCTFGLLSKIDSFRACETAGSTFDFPYSILGCSLASFNPPVFGLAFIFAIS